MMSVVRRTDSAVRPRQVVLFGCVLIAIICISGPAPACAGGPLPDALYPDGGRKRKLSYTEPTNLPVTKEELLTQIKSQSCGNLCPTGDAAAARDNEDDTKGLNELRCLKCEDIVRGHLSKHLDRMVSALSELYDDGPSNSRYTKKARVDGQSATRHRTDLFSWFRDQVDLWTEGSYEDFPSPDDEDDSIDSGDAAPTVPAWAGKNGDGGIGGTSENQGQPRRVPHGLGLSDMLESPGGSGDKETIDDAIIEDLRDKTKLKAGMEEAHLVPKSLTRHVEECKDAVQNATAVNLLLNGRSGNKGASEIRDKLQNSLKKGTCGELLPSFRHKHFIEHWPPLAIVSFLDKIQTNMTADGFEKCREAIENYRVPLEASLNSTCSGGFKTFYPKGDVASLDGPQRLLGGMPQYLRDLADGRGNEGGEWAYNPNNKNTEGLNMLSAPFILHRMGMDGVGNNDFGPALMLGWGVECGKSDSPVRSQWRDNRVHHVDQHPFVGSEQNVTVGATLLSDDECIVQVYGSRWRSSKFLEAIGRDGEWMMEQSLKLAIEAPINSERTKLKDDARSVTQEVFEADVNKLIQELLKSQNDPSDNKAQKEKKKENRNEKYLEINNMYEERYEGLQGRFRAWMFAGNLEVTVNRILRRRAVYCGWNKGGENRKGHFYSVERAADDDGWPEAFHAALERATTLLKETNQCTAWFKTPTETLLSS